MDIAFLSTFHPFRGGIAQFNARLYRQLEMGHTIRAYNFTTQYPSILFPGTSQYVIPTDPADPIPNERVLSSVNPFTFGPAAQQILSRKPGLLLTSFWMPFFGPSMGSVVKRMAQHGIKSVGILHNVVPHEPGWLDERLLRYYLPHNSGFIALTEAVKASLLNIHPSARVQVLAHPVYDHFGDKISRDEAMKILKLDPSKKSLLFFGLIRDYKGLDELIAAFGLLDASHQLVIAGEVYGSADKFQHMIDSSPNRDRIHLFNEYITDNRVPVFFSATDALVLPYRSGTQSGVAAIAWHFGVPVISTEVGGLRETLQHGKTGVLVKRSEAALIAEGIRALFNDFKPGHFQPHIAELREELSWKKFSDRLILFAGSL